MAMAVVAPLYSWLIAAAYSVCEEEGGGVGAGRVAQNSPPLSRRARRRLSRFGGGDNSNISSNSSLRPRLSSICGSSLQGFGSCFSFEACPEYYSSKQSPLFGDGVLGLGFGSRPAFRAARRHPKSAGSGKQFLHECMFIFFFLCACNSLHKFTFEFFYVYLLNLYACIWMCINWHFEP